MPWLIGLRRRAENVALFVVPAVTLKENLFVGLNVWRHPVGRSRLHPDRRGCHPS